MNGSSPDSPTRAASSQSKSSTSTRRECLMNFSICMASVPVPGATSRQRVRIAGRVRLHGGRSCEIVSPRALGRSAPRSWTYGDHLAASLSWSPTAPIGMFGILSLGAVPPRAGAARHEPSGDAELVAAMAAGDSGAALEAFYRRFGGLVLGLAERILASRAEAEEVL